MATSPPTDARKGVGPSHSAPLRSQHTGDGARSQDARQELPIREQRDALPVPAPQFPQTAPQVVSSGSMMEPTNPTGQFQPYPMPQPPPYYYPYPYPQYPQGMYPHSQYPYTPLPGTNPKQVYQDPIAQNLAPVFVICRSQSIPVPPIHQQGDSRRNSANPSRRYSREQTPSENRSRGHRTSQPIGRNLENTLNEAESSSKMGEHANLDNP